MLQVRRPLRWSSESTSRAKEVAQYSLNMPASIARLLIGCLAVALARPGRQPCGFQPQPHGPGRSPTPTLSANRRVTCAWLTRYCHPVAVQLLHGCQQIVDKKPNLEFRFGSGTGIRTPNLTVNRSLRAVQKSRFIIDVAVRRGRAPRAVELESEREPQPGLDLFHLQAIDCSRALGQIALV